MYLTFTFPVDNEERPDECGEGDWNDCRSPPVQLASVTYIYSMYNEANYVNDFTWLVIYLLLKMLLHKQLEP